ncbi:FecR family protein [Sphingobium indicum]|nr:FecR domain-containing protein [Sphingobium indicum]
MSGTIPLEIVTRAAEWAARFDAGDMSAADHASYVAWVGQDPRHGEALARIEANFNRLSAGDDLERTAARQLLQRKTRRRITGVVAAGVFVLSGWLIGYADWPTTQEFRTKRGEQHSVALADGSDLTLDSESLVEVSLGRKQRLIKLVKGQVYAEVAKDEDRPFVVETKDGTVTALGTAFVVRLFAKESIVTVTKSQVRVCPGRTNLEESRCRSLGPGNQARLTSGGVVAMSDVNAESAILWTRGWLEANNRDLVDVLLELDRYSPTPIRFDPASLAGRRVTGSFPLTDTTLALKGIEQASGVDVQRQNDGAIMIRPR